MSDQHQQRPFLTVHDVPIHFAQDWQSGRIGGGLWSTGMALARYFGTEAAADNLRRLSKHKKQGISVLELGSGNGFLAVCIAAVASAFPDTVRIKDLVVTDTADHLDQMRETVALNKEAMKRVDSVRVKEHVWGKFPEDADDDGTPQKYDLIVGSDVAYREHLYDPLIQSLRQY